MKKLFSLLMVLAIALQSCQPVETPNDNNGNNDTPQTPEQEQPVDTTLQSVVFEGNSVAVNGRGEASQAVIELKVTPSGCLTEVSKNWKSCITCAAKYTTGAVQSVSMPVSGYKANVKTGVVTVTVSGKNLSEAFYAGTQGASAVVTISTEAKSASSNPIKLVAGDEGEQDYNGLQKFPKQYEVKIMSFNVRLDTSETDATNNWPNRKEACVAVIKDQKPCLIGFQEAKYTSQWLYLKEQLKDEYDGWGVDRDTGKESGSGEVMGILYNKSKIQKVDGGTFWLSDTPDVCSIGWDAACKRTATWGIFKHIESNRNFLYVNTHLDHKGTEARVKGLELLAGFFAKYSSYNHFLSGDMNVESTHEAFSVLTSTMKNSRDAAPSGHTDKNTTYNAYTTGKMSIIDHIYCSKNLQVVEYHTINENYGVPYVSDHYPIYAIIKLM